MKERNKIKIRNSGYKKKKVIVPRARIKRRGSGCGEKENEEFISRRIQKRHAGRMIRKMRRMAEKGTPA